MAHPNVQRLREFLDAYAANDSEAIRKHLSDDAVWHVGGTHALSGDYRGTGEILDYFKNVGAEAGASMAGGTSRRQAAGRCRLTCSDSRRPFENPNAVSA